MADNSSPMADNSDATFDVAAEAADVSPPGWVMKCIQHFEKAVPWPDNDEASKHAKFIRMRFQNEKR